MKLNYVRPMILTAAVLALSAAANSQSNLIAKVPFSFRINGTTLPSSSYRLEMGTAGTRYVIRMVDVKGGKSAFALASTSSAEKTGNPRLVFQCSGEAGCDLAEIWNDDGSGLKMPKWHSKSSNYELAVIPLRHTDAE